jgi:DNA-binding MarR family transcriptional regulator
MEELSIDKEVVFGVLSGKASTAINRRLYRDFRTAGLNLTPEQWTILYSLSSKDGITQQELANTTYKDKPSITRLLDNLQKQMLIVRLADKTDKRINKIHITKVGLALNEKAQIIASQVMKDALNEISEEEIRLGESILKKIFKNLS